MLTTDSVDNSTYIALSQENKLGCTAWSGSDLDEMSIPYVVSRPSIWSIVSWDTTQPLDTILNTLAINPAGYYNDVGAVTQVRYFTPISYASRLAMFWRGGIIFKFNFGKTEFHSGRLSFEFFKTNIIEDQQPRTIVDLREGSEFIITVPYADPKPWSLVDNVAISGLRIRVLNPLVAPSTAESRIFFTIEVYAASDFELAGPVLPEVNLPPTFAVPAFDDRPLAVPQMETPEDVPGACDLSMDRVIGQNESIVDTISPANYCMGERFTSWRQLIKRFGLFYQNPNVTAVSVTPSILHNRAAVAFGQRPPDYFTMIVSCYNGNAGSIRFKSHISTRVPVTYRSSVQLATAAAATFNVTSAVAIPAVAGNFTIINSQSDRNAHEVAVPPYMTGLYRQQVSNTITPPSIGVDNLLYTTGLVFAGTLAATDFSNFNVYRAAGEDFNCGIFIGPPPLALN
jgi:hypothetical protein